jgi:hypothetical protein
MPIQVISLSIASSATKATRWNAEDSYAVEDKVLADSRKRQANS